MELEEHLNLSDVMHIMKIDANITLIKSIIQIYPYFKAASVNATYKCLQLTTSNSAIDQYSNQWVSIM